ncbi:STAS domain-containing protein [Rhodococcus sp. 14-2686-1-2]|nr:STAS domain-containing protein [Rhodococcus sp. 15-1189-1-1a]OZF18608.1 STAS domain-containing protein [Rhodococcus sp. 14-2686-1-2]
MTVTSPLRRERPGEDTMTTATPDSSYSWTDTNMPPSVVTDTAARYDIDEEAVSADRRVVRLAGEFEMESRTDIAAVLDRAMRTGSKVDVDLSAVTFLYSGAARSIIDAVAASEAFGQQMQVVGANRVACRIFTALGAEHLLRENSDRHA